MSSADHQTQGSLAVRNVSPPRTNGWGCPWHPLQVSAWSFLFLLTVSHYGFLVYYFPGYWRFVGYIVPGLILSFIIICLFVTTTIDPSDPHLKHKLTVGIFKRGYFNRSQHEHVIEDLHCHICDTDVTPKAKHCRTCDKCVEGFDHHCMWLNTCVGSKNYRWFIATVSSSLFGTVFAATLSMILFVLFFAHRDVIRHNCDSIYNITSCDDTIRIFGAAIPDPVFPTLTVLLAVLNIIASLLIGHLTFFHCYLMYRGISTYDYLSLKKEADNNSNDNKPLCLKQKKNRITPTMQEVDDGASSAGSAGKMTFSRTPPDSDSEEENKKGGSDEVSETKSNEFITIETSFVVENNGDGEFINSSNIDPTINQYLDVEQQNSNGTEVPTAFTCPQVSSGRRYTPEDMLPVEYSPSPEPISTINHRVFLQ